MKKSMWNCCAPDRRELGRKEGKCKSLYSFCCPPPQKNQFYIWHLFHGRDHNVPHQSLYHRFQEHHLFSGDELLNLACNVLSHKIYPLQAFLKLKEKLYFSCIWNTNSLLILHWKLQRAQKDELERIKHHYETSKEEEVKLLDKPEQ